MPHVSPETSTAISMYSPLTSYRRQMHGPTWATNDLAGPATSAATRWPWTTLRSPQTTESSRDCESLPKSTHGLIAIACQQLLNPCRRLAADGQSFRRCDPILPAHDVTAMTSGPQQPNARSAPASSPSGVRFPFFDRGSSPVADWELS